MFTSILIVFREVFEIAIIVSVILAATRQVAGRGYWVGGGIAAGTTVVGILACFAPAINGLATQLGQHVFHALVLFMASGLITWSVIWMQKHGREIAARMKEVSLSVSSGKSPLYMLAVVVGLAVLREGSEIVLFQYGIYASGEAGMSDLIMGTIIGTWLGVFTGLLMYFGLIRIPVKQLFSISGWLLAFLAAGMIAKGVGHLVKADILPALINPLWDTSAILSQKSLVGRFLSIVIGYQDHPAGIQVLFYVITLALISMTLLPKSPAKIKL
jgi:high-affinity iron transporter